MDIDNPVQLENRPLVLQSNVDENTGEAIVTNVESTTLDLHSLHVNDYNYQLKALAKTGGASKVQLSITESDANVLSLACLNPGESVFSSSLTTFGFDLGTPPIATMRKYCEFVAVPTLTFDESGNFIGISNNDAEISFKLSSVEGSLEAGPNLFLNGTETAVVDGYTKLVSLYGKSWDGITVKLMANADGTLDIAVGDSFWTQFVTRNEGLVIAPKVTGLDTPVEASDAVNLAYVEDQVADLQAADAENLVYINQKVQELSDSIANQDSFFVPTEQRWTGSRAVVFDASGEKAQLPDMTSLSNSSSVMGVALTNPAIDESGLTPEQIALSYNRRVYTAGVVRNVVSAWASPKGDVFAGPNGTLVEIAPTSGRIIKLGQKINAGDLLLGIQDYGYVFGVSSSRPTYNFGTLTPSPNPPELGMSSFLLFNEYMELASGLEVNYGGDILQGIRRPGVQTLSDDGELGIQAKALSDDLTERNGKMPSNSGAFILGEKCIDGTGVLALYACAFGDMNHPSVSRVAKFDFEGNLIKQVEVLSVDYNNGAEALKWENVPVMLSSRSDGGFVFFSKLYIYGAGWSYLGDNPTSVEAERFFVPSFEGPGGGYKAWVYNSEFELTGVYPFDPGAEGIWSGDIISLPSNLFWNSQDLPRYDGKAVKSDGALIFPTQGYNNQTDASGLLINKFNPDNTWSYYMAPTINAVSSAGFPNGTMGTDNEWTSGGSIAVAPEVMLSNGDYLIGCQQGIVKFSNDNVISEILVNDMENLGLGQVLLIHSLSEFSDGTVAMVVKTTDSVRYVRKLNVDGTLTNPIPIFSSNEYSYAAYGYARPDGIYVVVGATSDGRKIIVSFVNFATESVTYTEVTEDEYGPLGASPYTVTFDYQAHARAVSPDGAFLCHFWRADNNSGQWRDSQPLLLIKPDNSISVINSLQPHQNPIEPVSEWGDPIADGPGAKCFVIIR